MVFIPLDSILHLLVEYTLTGVVPLPPTMNHIIVDFLACNLLFFFQQCWTFSPFQCVGILLNLGCLSHLSPSFPPCSLPGTQTTVQCSLASKWVWPWERCAGCQGKRKENEVGGSCLTFSLRGSQVGYGRRGRLTTPLKAHSAGSGPRHGNSPLLLVLWPSSHTCFVSQPNL